MAQQKGSSKRRYTDQEKGAVLAQLELNNGNVKGTARATGIPWETIRTWKQAAERLRHDSSYKSTIITPKVLEYKELSHEGFVAQAEIVRDQALEKLKMLIPQATAANIAALTNLTVVLSDRIDRAKGIADRTTVVEHRHQINPSEEWVKTLTEYVSSTRGDAVERSLDIIDADIVEQPLGLPAVEGDEEDE